MDTLKLTSRTLAVLLAVLLGSALGTRVALAHGESFGGHGGGGVRASAPSGSRGFAHANYGRATGGFAGHYSAPVTRSAPVARPPAGYGAGYTRGTYGGYGGYRGNYGRGYWNGGYWRGGVWFGGFIPALPLFYDTFWWGGIPYYYADDTYYVWSSAANQYQVVPPPGASAPVAENDASAPASSPDLVVYPNNGQSDEQRSRDRYECYRWAANQSGFDPTQPNGGGSAGAEAPGGRDSYLRAEAACLEGRGYTVK